MRRRVNAKQNHFRLTRMKDVYRPNTSSQTHELYVPRECESWCRSRGYWGEFRLGGKLYYGVTDLSGDDNQASNKPSGGQGGI